MKKLRTMPFGIFCFSLRYVITYEYRLREFEKRMLKSIFGCRRKEVTSGGRKSLMRSYTICDYHQVGLFVRQLNEEG
jgi:hypothetical protein